ncbi:MAG: DUF2865 domain-containing protein [Notoacmeibacter sp.]|nr:DUF2865 domain-containing protein [Notoacmeibacter sp.]
MRVLAARIGKLFGAALVAAAMAMPVVTVANAASSVCRQLERQLAAASNEARGKVMPARYERAIREQKRQLSIAENQASRRGCSGSIAFFGGTGGDACAQIRSSIRSMRANLAKLESASGRLSRQSTSGADKARILAKIEANRCREPKRAAKFDHVRRLPPPIDSTARRDEALLNRLFKGNLRHRQSSETNWLEPDDGRIVGGATFRTLCVRTCDGYFFPMSFSTTEDFFSRDEQACQAMCPGTEVRLYTHKAEGEESEDMVSLSGEPYSALSTAYNYRDPDITQAKGCACNAAKDFSILAGKEAEEKPVDPMDLAPPPRERPDPALDPETAMNADGGLTAEAVRKLLLSKPAVTAEAPDDDRKVRVVGPAFLPDPEEAIDLRAPAPTAVR